MRLNVKFANVQPTDELQSLGHERVYQYPLFSVHGNKPMVFNQLGTQTSQ